MGRFDDSRRQDLVHYALEHFPAGTGRHVRIDAKRFLRDHDLERARVQEAKSDVASICWRWRALHESTSSTRVSIVEKSKENHMYRSQNLLRLRVAAE